MSAAAKLADSLDLGPVHIAVTDLDRSVGFYQDAIGLQVRERSDMDASLGAGGEELLHPWRTATHGRRVVMPGSTTSPS